MNLRYHTVRAVSSKVGNSNDSSEPARKLAMGTNVIILLRS
jgi:hypothetical protein